MEIISWDRKTNIILFKKDGQLYKAKILSVNIQQNTLDLYVFNTNQTITINLAQQQKSAPTSARSPHDRNNIVSPISGRVVKIHVKVGDHVQKNMPLVTIESMKMENEIRASFDLFVKTVPIAESDLVKHNQLLLTVEEPEVGEKKL